MKTNKGLLTLVKEQAHLLGGIYYAWSILSALAGMAYSGYKLLATPAISGTSEILFYVFVAAVVAVMIMVPLLAANIFQRVSGVKPTVANPSLRVESRDVKYTIRRGGLLKRQRLMLLALGSTNSFRMTVGLTGNGMTRVTPTSDGLTLLGPVARGSTDAYELQFGTPMAKGETRAIEFDIEISDEKCTMRPFLTDIFHSAASYGSFRATYQFDGFPTSVVSDRLSTNGESLGNMRLLIPQITPAGALYEVSVPKIDHHCSYTVSWVW